MSCPRAPHEEESFCAHRVQTHTACSRAPCDWLCAFRRARTTVRRSRQNLPLWESTPWVTRSCSKFHSAISSSSSSLLVLGAFTEMLPAGHPPNRPIVVNVTYVQFCHVSHIGQACRSVDYLSMPTSRLSDSPPSHGERAKVPSGSQRRMCQWASRLLLTLDFGVFSSSEMYASTDLMSQALQVTVGKPGPEHTGN